MFLKKFKEKLGQINHLNKLVGKIASWLSTVDHWVYQSDCLIFDPVVSVGNWL